MAAAALRARDAFYINLPAIAVCYASVLKHHVIITLPVLAMLRIPCRPASAGEKREI